MRSDRLLFTLSIAISSSGAVGCFDYPGTLGERCTAEGLCEPGLACVEGVCVEDARVRPDAGVPEDAGVPVPVCGDGRIDPPEVCDGTMFGARTCGSVTGDRPDGVLTCAPGCLTVDTGGCYDCGNATIEGPELCDGAELASNTCETVTSTAPLGVLACAADCRGFDVSGCHACGDGACGEADAALCPDDCAWEQIAAGQNTTCGVRRDGSVWCWGENHMGQFGNGTNRPSSRPVRANLALPMRAVTADSTSCAITRVGGRVFCWGLNDRGELGDGTTIGDDFCPIGPGRLACEFTPVEAGPITGAIAIGANGSHVCALKDDGTVWCWGQNGGGELGRGGAIYPWSATPAPVVNLRGATALAVGVNHNCALAEAGQVYCWGANGQFQLGVPRLPGDVSSEPRLVEGVTGAIAIAAGNRFSCVVLADHTVRCWGWNDVGALGDPSLPLGAMSQTPVQVAGVSDAVALHAGYDHVCARRMNGLVACWGSNRNGELCNGEMVTAQQSPVAAAFPVTATVATGGWYHTCAISPDGRAQCCGSNELGQLGDGTTRSSTVPVSVID